MKLFICVIIWILIATVSCKHETPECEKVRTGKFEMKSEDGATFHITRNSAKQTEEEVGKDMMYEYDVVWIDECTYLLINPRTIKGVDASGSETYSDTLTNTITQTDEKGYTVVSKFNSKDTQMEFELRRIE